MRIALKQAKYAAARGEIPVGALLVNQKGSIVAAHGNNCRQAHDPTGHAEIRALRDAGQQLENYRFPGTTMYVTLEPCAMCAAALVHARIERIVFGATDAKAGALISKYSIGTDGRLNHSFSITQGVLEEECRRILVHFFRKRR
ncbi:MAG: tRNA-specific adenosine deaminase [Desulfobulbus propionicus]|nr:MAG: tRNA-specific adenosine deaminase [Desulfobulbus propionicus]